MKVADVVVSIDSINVLLAHIWIEMSASSRMVFFLVCCPYLIFSLHNLSFCCALFATNFGPSCLDLKLDVSSFVMVCRFLCRRAYVAVGNPLQNENVGIKVEILRHQGGVQGRACQRLKKQSINKIDKSINTHTPPHTHTHRERERERERERARETHTQYRGRRR